LCAWKSPAGFRARREILSTSEIDYFPFHRFRTASPRQCHLCDSKDILRRLIRQKKGCHKEHTEHKVSREIVFVPYVFFVADLAFPDRSSPPCQKKLEFRPNSGTHREGLSVVSESWSPKKLPLYEEGDPARSGVYSARRMLQRGEYHSRKERSSFIYKFFPPYGLEQTLCKKNTTLKYLDLFKVRAFQIISIELLEDLMFVTLRNTLI